MLPKRTKFYIIRNERKRINQRCSTRHESRDKHNSDVDEILRLNGYPQHILETLQKEVSTYISYNSSQQQQQTISIFCEWVNFLILIFILWTHTHTHIHTQRLIHWTGCFRKRNTKNATQKTQHVRQHIAYRHKNSLSPLSIVERYREIYLSISRIICQRIQRVNMRYTTNAFTCNINYSLSFSFAYSISP